MKWIRKILWLVFGLCIALIILIHAGSAYMRYSTDDIKEVLPDATIAIDFYGNTKVRTVFLDNQSDTLLVFVHGAPGSFDAFLSYMSDSSFQSYNLLSYDRPGYGESSYSPMPSIVEQSNILLNIINRYSSNYIVLIGHSYGGPIAGYTTAIHPKIIDKAIMVAPLLDPEQEPIFWFSYFSIWPWTKWLLTNDLKTSGTEKFQHAKALKEIEPFWKQLKRPILHIHGGADGLAPPTYNIDYSRLMIDSNYIELRIFPNEGHLILWEEFELTKGLILDFVQM